MVRTELAFICGQKAYWEFQKLMGDLKILEVNNSAVEGTGENKGVNATYKYYEIAGVRVVPQLYKWFDSPDRPQTIRDDGTRNDSWKGILFLWVMHKAAKQVLSLSLCVIV
jgi:hypothetical protein